MSPESGRVLIIFTPGGQEQAFVEFAALAAESGDHDDAGDRFLEIVHRYDSEIVAPSK